MRATSSLREGARLASQPSLDLPSQPASAVAAEKGPGRRRSRPALRGLEEEGHAGPDEQPRTEHKPQHLVIVARPWAKGADPP